MSTTDAKLQAYITAIRKYYSDEYIRLLGITSLEGGVLKPLLDNPNMHVWSHKTRIVRNIQILKHTFVTGKTNMITSCFKMTLDATSCIYGYVHFQCEHGEKGKNAMSPRFVCAGPTFRSQDGEYRRRLITWAQFIKLFTHYADQFNDIETLAVSKMEAGRLTFQVDFYYPMGCLYEEADIYEFINLHRLPIKLYIMCWAYDYYMIHFKEIENHVNPAYQQIIYQQEDLPAFEKLLAKVTPERYTMMMNRIAEYKYDPSEPDYNIVELEVGQKIFPLSAIEAVKTDDINFNVWREIYVANLTSNLVLNLIAPSFPFINNWFYVQNSHAGLFDNLAMHEKYMHSATATDISNQLKNIDTFNYVKADRDQGPVSNKFFRLSKSIHKSIIYADSDIKLTDLAVCATSEYVGRTLRDLPAVIEYSKNYNKYDVAYDMTFTNIDTFTRHMFEFIYAFYCMNSKIGIIHGDLHMNNATIMALYHVFTEEGDSIIKDPHVLYIVNDMYFMYPHTGLFSMIIDFSRAIIGDYARLEHEFSTRYADMYFAEQRIRVLQTIYSYFPKLVMKYREHIEALLLTSFPLMFKILSVIDTYVIMNNISAMFSIDDTFVSEKIKIAPGAQKLLKGIIQHAEQLFVNNIHAVVEGRVTRPEDIEWPNLIILKDRFASYSIKASEVINPANNIVDIFNSNNPVTYDVEDYDTWGPLLSIDKEIELRKKYKQAIHPDTVEWVKFKQTDESPVVAALTSKYEQQEKDVLQFEEWMLM